MILLFELGTRSVKGLLLKSRAEAETLYFRSVANLFGPSPCNRLPGRYETTAVRNNVQSANNLGLLALYESPFDAFSSGEQRARPTPSPPTAVQRDPYLTRGRTARLNADAAAAASAKKTKPRHRRHAGDKTTTSPSCSTTAGLPQGSPPSRPASTPIVDTEHGDFEGAGERVVPGGPSKTNQWF